MSLSPTTLGRRIIRDAAPGAQRWRLGADGGFTLDGGLGALSTCDFSIGSGSFELDPVSTLWYDPATYTLRLLFPLSMISENEVFNYLVWSTAGGSGGTDQTPDSSNFRSAGHFFTSDVGDLPPFGGALLCARETIAIDINPGRFPNLINTRSRRMIPVAVLATDSFDATTLDPTTARFGARGTEAVPLQFAQEDVDGDGDVDLIFRFNTRQTGIQCGDTFASLTAKTFDGRALTGADSIMPVGCR